MAGTGTDAGTGTGVDPGTLETTRRTLHGVAELVIAGPQHRRVGEIALAVTPGGFRGEPLGVGVEGVRLHFEGGSTPLAGTYRGLAEAAGVDVGAPRDLYRDVTGIDPDDELVVDPAAAAVLAAGWRRGYEALRLFAPQEPPILWPEHFDVGITVDEVTYGVSPGDSFHPTPYAYVAPWSLPEGEFWNAPFGSCRAVDDLADAPARAAYFAEGRRLAAG